MKEYTLFWLHGEKQIVKGNSPSEAMNNAGIGAGALRALDFFAEGKSADEWYWDAEELSWRKFKQQYK